MKMNSIHKPYKEIQDETLKSKLRDLTFQTLKNTINSIDTLVFLHKLLNSPENSDAKMRLGLEENLINLRNRTLQKTSENQSDLLGHLMSLRKRLGMDASSYQLGLEVDEHMAKMRRSWDARVVNPEEMRDNLTDILRIVDPDAAPVPRVVSKNSFGGMNGGDVVNKNYISVGNENFGTQNSAFNANVSTIQSSRIGQTPFNGSLRGSNMIPSDVRRAEGMGNFSPRASTTRVTHVSPSIRTTVTHTIGNIVQPGKPLAQNQIGETARNLTPSRKQIGKPRYYRLDDNGNRVEIDGPPQPMGTPSRVRSSMIGTSPIRNAKPPLVNISTHNSAFNTQNLNRSPNRLRHSNINMTPQRRPMGMAPLTPSRMITPNTPPPALATRAYPTTSPLRIFPQTPNRMTPSRVSQIGISNTIIGNPHSQKPYTQVGGVRASAIRPEQTKGISQDARIMLADAKEDFSNPEIELFDCHDCKFPSNISSGQNRMLIQR